MKVTKCPPNSSPHWGKNSNPKLRKEINTNASPNVKRSDFHLDLAGHCVTFIKVEHAPNYVHFLIFMDYRVMYLMLGTRMRSCSKQLSYISVLSGFKMSGCVAFFLVFSSSRSLSRAALVQFSLFSLFVSVHGYDSKALYYCMV